MDLLVLQSNCYKYVYKRPVYCDHPGITNDCSDSGVYRYNGVITSHASPLSDTMLYMHF